jgi:hypothetical protein
VSFSITDREITRNKSMWMDDNVKRDHGAIGWGGVF